MEALGGLAQPRQAGPFPPGGFERHLDSCGWINGAEIAQRPGDTGAADVVDLGDVRGGYRPDVGDMRDMDAALAR